MRFRDRGLGFLVLFVIVYYGFYRRVVFVICFGLEEFRMVSLFGVWGGSGDWVVLGNRGDKLFRF